MMFFQVEGLLLEDTADIDENRRRQREKYRKIFLKTLSFNAKHRDRGFCFVALYGENQMSACILAPNGNNIQGLAEDFLQAIDCPLQEITVTETTLIQFDQLLSRASRYDLVEDYNEVLNRFGLDKVLGRHGHGLEFGESIIANTTRDEIIEGTQRLLLGETFLPELERIYAGSAMKNVQGHPVHYMLQVDNLDTRREGCRLLLQALYNNNRLSSRRYCFLNFRPGEDFSLLAHDSLFQVCAGGAVIIRYYAGAQEEASDMANNERETIEKICELVKNNRKHTLTILCLPRDCAQTKQLFFENLGNLTFVQLREDLTTGAQAESYLKHLAKQAHIRTDKKLFAQLEAEKTYVPAELQSIFDQWYDRKLKTSVYPQYKEITAIKAEVVKATPKGSAYDELQEMIGLTEAKSVIHKALNYYKMQKLYESKGIPTDSPAMHMVFTGNPGTAKTSVARLFARIMKDNGLLTRGQLVEVGRGDLVGKFVGWTAQIVQAKFRAARGGVLFIDEAYSLVDDRSGSFGDEAINTIVQEMENHREDVVVIFAGYPKEMESFLQKNPGLRSRIAFHVPFADYSTEELCSIAQLMGKHKGVHFEPAALKKLQTLFQSAAQQGDFGNGRYVRNVLEQAKMNQASRLLEYDFDDITAEEIKTIRAEDVQLPDILNQEKRTIGFAS